MSSAVPLLSVVIAAYKSRDEIKACLASLPRSFALQTGKSAWTEIIVVDNSPGEGTGEIIRRDFPWVKYLPAEKNLGFGRANNLGYAHSSGSFILFLNPDTISVSATLVHCLERLIKEETIGLISPRLILADGSLDLACRRSIPTLWDGFCRAAGLASRFPRVKLFGGYNLTYLPIDGTYDVGAINGAFLLGPRRVFAEVGVFDEAFFMYGDDLDLCIRVAKEGWRIVYDGRVQMTHLKGTSVAKDFGLMSHAIFDANRDVYLKHFNPKNSVFIRWKYLLAFGAWKWLALLRGRLRGRRRVRPI